MQWSVSKTGEKRGDTKNENGPLALSAATSVKRVGKAKKSKKRIKLLF